MVRIELAPEILDDTERFINHQEQHEVTNVAERVGGVLEGFQILARSPLVGRPVGSEKRELIIGQGNRGHVALYRYLAGIETIFILAMRAQRESGFKH